MLQAVQRHLDARWVLALFALLLVSGIWGSTLWQLEQDQRRAIAVAEREAQDLVRLFDEHASRTISAADQAVTFLRHRYNSLGTKLDMKRELAEGLGPAICTPCSPSSTSMPTWCCRPSRLPPSIWPTGPISASTCSPGRICCM
jgi:hypothetical protein